MEIRARKATSTRNELGEGVIWDDRTDTLIWVDIPAGTILRGRLAGGGVEIVSTIQLEGFAGAVALADDGGLLAAGTRSLVAISPEGDISYGPDLLAGISGVRLNDGSVDPQGRFVVGSLALESPGSRERLLRVSPDGGVEILRTGITLSNGIGFSPDGATIYHVDTIIGTVCSHSYGPGDFNTDEPWQLVLDSFDSVPDGLTVDAEGSLWVAEWEGGRVRRYAATGEILATVTVDAPRTTCPGFVGPGLDTLAITSASAGLGVPDTGRLGFPVSGRAGSTGHGGTPVGRKHTNPVLGGAPFAVNPAPHAAV